MKNCKDKFIDSPAFNYLHSTPLPTIPKRVKEADARIRDLIIDRGISTPKFLTEMHNLKTQLSGYSKRIDRKIKALANAEPACDPQTRKIQGILSERQGRWLKYFSPKTMTPEEVEVFNSWSEVAKTSEQIKIDELIKTINIVSSLYSNKRINNFSKKPHGMGARYTLDHYRDRYSLSSTSVAMLALVQLKLIAEDILFLLTSIVKSIYFLSLSETIREKILNARLNIQQLVLGKFEKNNRAGEYTQIFKDIEHGHFQKNLGLADRRLDKMGKELMLRYLGQLSLSLKTIKLIKLRTSEHWQKTVARAKSRAIAKVQLEKKVGSFNWRAKLRRDMTLKVGSLPDPHVYNITVKRGATDLYNGVLIEAAHLEEIVSDDLIKSVAADLEDLKLQSDEEVERSQNVEEEIDEPKDHIPDWANW